MAVHNNTATLTVGYNITTPNPVDGRTIVSVKTDLIDNTKWNKTVEFYNGLPVYVQATNELYYLMDKEHALVTLSTATPEQIAAAYDCWKKMASYKELDDMVKELGPVFVFKGVAQAISPDKRAITVEGASYTPHGASSDVSVVCLGYEHGFPNLYYAWGTIDASNGDGHVYFYTNTPGIALDSSQYKKGNSSENIFYVDDASLSAKRYYFDASVANEDASASVDSSVMWKFTDEDDISHIYCVAPSGADAPSADVADASFYLDADTSEDLYDVLDVEHFASYKFTKMSSSEKGTINSLLDPSRVIFADNTNNGHVYQIVEDEYASNGLIWVQLGSPDNEWIVI